MSHEAEMALELFRGLMHDAQQALPTRRERIATAALQGILAADAGNQTQRRQRLAVDDEKDAVRSAVLLADALIAELDKQEPVFSTTSKRQLRDAWNAGAEAALDEFHASPSGPELDRFYAKNPHAEGGDS